MSTARVRALGIILVITCAGLLIAGGATFWFQYVRTVASVDDHLREKTAALPAPTEGTSVQNYLTQAVDGFLPSTSEAAVGVIDGRVVAVPTAGVKLAAAEDPAFVRSAAGRADAAGATVIDDAVVAGGTVRFIAMPVRIGDDAGVYLRVIDLDDELLPLRSSVATYAIVSLAVLIGLGFASWFATGRLLAPLRDLRDTADSVSLDNLGARVPEHGDPEVSDVSRTMNAMLERLETAVGSQRRLLDDIRHELKTPITIVRGHLETMDIEDPADVASTRDIGISELDRMTRLVEDIDLLSSAQADQFEMKPIYVESLTDRVGELVGAIPGHPFRLERRARGVVVADSDRLTQAWLQLADNAAKYTPAGTPIEIGSDLDDGQLRLWVRDHGPGIPPAARHRIFQRFARVDANRQIGGSGLGLAIVDAIAQAHRGSCDVADTPGGGATFTIHLPTGRNPASVIPTPVRAGDVVLQREAAS